MQDKSGRWYSLRVRPYKTLDNKIDGAVIVLVDIDALKRSEQDIKTARDYAEAIVRTARDPLLVLHADLKVDTANEAFYNTFKVTPVATEGHLIYELGDGQWNIPKLRELLEDILPRKSFFNNFEITHDFANIGRRTMLLNARKLSDAEGRPARILLGIQDITEALQHQEVWENQTRYQALVKATAQIVWTTDATGAVMDDSPSWRAFTGQTYEQWKGFGWLDALHPEDRERIRELWQRALAEHTSMETEYRLRHVSGEWRWMTARAVPLLNPSGAVREWVGMNLDITDRKQAEVIRARLAAIVESSDDAIVSKDLNGVITSWNASAERLFGYTAQEVVGKPVTIFIPPQRLDEEAVILEHIRRKEPVEHYETVRRRKDGTLVDVSLTISPLVDGQGRIMGASKIARDITDRRRAEEALRASEERYRTLFDSAPMAVFVCDRNAVIQQYNSRAVELWGREPVCGVEQYCGSVKLWLPDGTLLPHTLTPLVEVLRTGIPELNVEVYIERPDGSRLPVLANFAALKNAQEEIIGGITSFIDIADRKRAEGLLKEADRRKDEFLGMLAHELRTPMSAISNVTEILGQQRTSDPETTRLQSMLTRQTRTLTRMVDDLLDISRITSGKIRLEKELIALSPVISRAVESTRSLMESRRHELIVSEPDAPLRLEADATRLEQILVNLLSNAAKYTDPGGRIHLMAKQENERVCLIVRDNGIGISAEMLSRVFEMFAQVDQSLERTQGGLGIGLALVRRLVELHGGTVQVTSAGVGQGSEFIVRLPLGTMPRQDQGATEFAPVQSTIGSARRILVVEDNQDAAESLATLIELMGHEVRSVHDGASALETAAAFRPDVVLLDIGLPDINGYQVAPRLRQQSGLERIALAALTGWGQEEDRLRARTAGFDQHFVKPIDVDDLRAWLASLDPA